MNLPININDLLTARTVEWERLEFKAGWNPEKILRILCALANDFHNLGGGYIIVGVDEDDGRPVLPPVGLPAGRLDAIQKGIIELGYRMVPYYHPIIAPCEIYGKHLLVLWAIGGQTRPYKAPVSLAGGEREFAYYIRKGSVTVKATPQDERELLTLAATVPFDDRMNQQARVEDLSRDLIQEYLHHVKSDLAVQADGLSLLELSRQVQVVGGAPEAPLPLNVGLMMFNPEPHRFFPSCRSM
jgi:ATP-dependent DNA helicase RecG